jgi:hypothetical protein
LIAHSGLIREALLLVKVPGSADNAADTDVVKAALKEVERDERAARRARHFRAAQQWDYEGWLRLRDGGKVARWTRSSRLDHGR